jgi:hypothetical protein
MKHTRKRPDTNRQDPIMTMFDDLTAAAREAKQDLAADAAAIAATGAEGAARDAEFLWAMEFSDSHSLMPKWIGHAAVDDGVPFATAEIAPETWLTCLARGVPGSIRVAGTVSLVHRCPSCGRWREDPISSLTDFDAAANPPCDGTAHTFRTLPQHQGADAEGSSAR